MEELSERSVTGFICPSTSASTATITAAETAAAVPIAPPSTDHDSINGKVYSGQNPIPLSNHRHHYPFHLQTSSSSISPQSLFQRSRGASCAASDADAIKARIMAHPQCFSLLNAYIDCQKVGAPADVANRLSTAVDEFNSRQQQEGQRSSRADETVDPELDQFMEAYQQMLVKYREELMKPLQEAMEFLRRMESQLNSLTDGSFRVFTSDHEKHGGCSSEEDQEGSGGESDQLPEINPRAKDRELKNHLLKKYSGQLRNLRQELSKKRKKGKLPKEARLKLLHWWELHYKWPYPSETEKVALAESTGLDQKQINNWFINQRKRHWKPAEDMQFAVIEGYPPPLAAAATATFYMAGQFIGNGLHHLGP